MNTQASAAKALPWPDLTPVFAPADATSDAGAAEATQADGVPIHLVQAPFDATADKLGLTSQQQRWLAESGFKGNDGETALVPAEDGTLACVIYSIGARKSGIPCGGLEFLVGRLAVRLPPRPYRLLGLTDAAAHRAALAFGLGSYRFDALKSNPPSTSNTNSPDANQSSLQRPQIIVGTSDAGNQAFHAEIEAVWLARDLINTPASHLGPAELAATIEQLAERHGAHCSVVSGDDLLTNNFPMIHAVGRASTREPRLIDLQWSPENSSDTQGEQLPKVTLVGKGVVFDTGGLDLKPASAMLLMKKDMGGAATAIAVAHMIMAANLPVRLRLLVSAVENSVSGNAFRPGDVLTSRSGRTVEIGNTDAEGRLVLADALTLADEEHPDHIISFATLTGAARVALGADLPAMFSTDDGFANSVHATGEANADPVWRLPFWNNYDERLKSAVADFNNISDGPFAGAITAALFLRRFVQNAQSFAHFDLYGWRPAPAPLGPKGGEPNSARAVFAALREKYEGADA